MAVMVEVEEERGGSVKEGKHQADLFYTYYGMVASSVPRWVQGAFYTLIGMFDRVGLCTNVGKTVGVVFRAFQAAGNQLESAYRRRIMGEGPTYR